ncbi:glycosyltransferase [Nitriliruptor alkaliphilus]|uniref:glycosyltransferase n=1 Tax=Nitriliruptor alkaliphilus TaxID=427918 RepID=UPI000697DEAF|nr:glycosyltransferase family 2 protein [Nitriliruptor alkaliphilus]
MRRLLPVAAAAAVWSVLGYRAFLLSRTAGAVALVFFGLFCLRIALAWRDRPGSGTAPIADVAVVLPVFNEDPELLRRCLVSLTEQSRLPSRVWLVDDGSHDTAAIELAAAFVAPFPIHVLRCEENRGKRAIQAEAFGRDYLAEVFVTSDSDTIFDRHAIAEGLRRFASPDVTAVAGVVRPLNRARNLLTRIQDAEYLASFLVGRASLSSLRGSILVTSGGLAFYRAEVVREVLEEYLGQTFAGRPVHTGDDRMLTQLCLQRGRVVLQHTAVAETAVPEQLSHLLRQRVRWSRSFWVNSLWVLTNMTARGLPFWITVYHLTSVLAFALMLGALAILVPTASLLFLGVYLATSVVLGYLQAARLLVVSLPGDTPGRQLATYLAVGAAVLFNLIVLVPVRFWALIRVRDVTRWGTRAEVEVTVATLASAILFTAGQPARRSAPAAARTPARPVTGATPAQPVTVAPRAHRAPGTPSPPPTVPPPGAPRSTPAPTVLPPGAAFPRTGPSEASPVGRPHVAGGAAPLFAAHIPTGRPRRSDLRRRSRRRQWEIVGQRRVDELRVPASPRRR